MTRLVKIELKKLFAKKMIYIYLVVVSCLALSVAILQKYASKIADIMDGNYENINILKGQLDAYDLSDPSQLEDYVEDKSYYEARLLAKEYDKESPEAGFINREIYDTLSCMNYNEFITKNNTAYEECKKQYDEQVAMLDHFDWKAYLKHEKEELDDEIRQMEFAINASVVDEEEVKLELENLKLERKVMEYRIEKGIPIQLTPSSTALDTYLLFRTSYNPNEKINEKDYTARFKKERAKAEAAILDFKFEHDYFLEDDERIIDDLGTSQSVRSIFGNNFLTLLFLILVGGGIIAEEFNKGTIKQLLLKPYSRFKIFTSKVLACLIVFFFFLVTYSVITAVLESLVFMEVRSLITPIPIYNYATSTVVEQSLLLNCFESLIAVLPMYLIILGTSLLIGIVTTNTSTAIIVPIVLSVAADIINAIATGKIFAFFPTMCWDLTEMLHGGMASYQGITLASALVVDVITIAALFTASYLVFKKKDIKNQ